MTSLATTRAIERSGGHLYTYVDAEGRHGPYPGATAITALQDSLGGSDGLLTWAVNLALDEVERHEFMGADWEWPMIRATALQAKNVARDLGSDVHSAIDQFNRGLPLELTPQVGPFVAQYAAWVRNHKVEILSSEKFVVSTSVGFGGTYDLLARIDGELALCDIKTGKQKVSQRLQLAGLSMGELHADRNEEPEAMPKIDTAYIVLVRPDSAPELVRHEITDADREHFIHLVETYHRIKSWAAEFAPTALREEAA